MTSTMEERGKAAETALGADDIDDVLSAVERMAPDADVKDLARIARRALQGDRAAVRDYVRGYQAFTAAMLSAAHAARPDLVIEQDDGTLVLIDVKGHPTRAPLAALDDGGVSLVSSPWVTAYGPADGLALDTIARLRASLADTTVLVFPHHGGVPHWDVDEASLLAFVATVRQEIAAPSTPLDTISESFRLNETDLAGLFGVRRQALSQWRSAGIPASRIAKVTTVASLANLLTRKLKAERVPGIARRAADAYGGLTMLEMIEADRQDELLELVRASFDPSQVA
jgi:glyoxylase-like metal-dependent hydrolase (beta-lactamase superfamily II)